MIRFLHAADLHLDSPFHGLSPEDAARRRQEQRQLLTEIAELANSQNCDLVLLAGDLFDSGSVYPETVEVLLRALGSIRAKIFISPGNHDYLCPGSPYLTAGFPENVHIFDGGIRAVPIPELDCTVYGAAFSAQTAPSLLEGFRVTDETMQNIMVLHGDPETAQSLYNSVTKQQIEQSRLDYLALGHIHQRSGPHKQGKTVYAWPGCPMGRGFDELGEKGVYVGELSKQGCTLTFHPLRGRRYEIWEVPAGADPLSAIEAALPQNTENIICRIRLTGEADPVDLRALLAALSPRFHALQLRDETVPKIDIWQFAGEDSLRGRYLALLQEKLETAAEEEKAILLLAAKLGLSAMEGREEVPPC